MNLKSKLTIASIRQDINEDLMGRHNGYRDLVEGRRDRFNKREVPLFSSRVMVHSNGVMECSDYFPSTSARCCNSR